MLLRKPPPQGLSWRWVWKKKKVVLPQTSVEFSFYTGSANWSVDTGKALIELTAMQILEAKCAWLKHDWDCAVDEAADFTGCACKTRGGIVSPTCERARERKLFLHEYQVEECNAEPLAAVIANSCCKLRLSLLPPVPPPTARDEKSATGLARADITAFCYVVRKLRVWCNWWSLLIKQKVNQQNLS